MTILPLLSSARPPLPPSVLDAEGLRKLTARIQVRPCLRVAGEGGVPFPPVCLCVRHNPNHPTTLVVQAPLAPLSFTPLLCQGPPAS